MADVPRNATKRRMLGGRVLARRKIALGAAAVIAAAVAVTAVISAQSSATNNNDTAQANLGQPQINWDRPLPGGVVASAITARTVGRLAFTPSLPRFALRPTLVEVTNASATAPNWRAVAYVYRFPLGPGFRGDGRVRVLEYQTKVTESQLEAVAANPPGPPADFRVIRVNGHGALLVQGNGIGRVQYILKGVMYDVTGPAISPAAAERLAAQIRT
jgi:hypothetical protein